MSISPFSFRILIVSLRVLESLQEALLKQDAWTLLPSPASDKQTSESILGR